MSESRVNLSPGVYVAGVAGFALLLTMVVLLTLLLGVLRDSQQHIRDTDARIARIERNSAPALEKARPALRQVAPTLKQARPLLREARGLIGPLGVAVEGITSAAGRFSTLVAEVGIVADGFPALLADVDTVAGVAGSDRVRAALDALPQLHSLPRVEQLTADLDQKAGRGIEILLQSLRAQQRSLRVQFRLLAIGGETLRHVRSIDTKFGGQVPAATGLP